MPPQCLSLQSDLAHIKSLQQEFSLALDQAQETGDLTEAKRLKAEIEQKTASLAENTDVMEKDIEEECAFEDKKS